MRKSPAAWCAALFLFAGCGDDDKGTAAGTGLRSDNGAIAVDPSRVPLVMSCGDGQFVQRGPNNTWQCATIAAAGGASGSAGMGGGGMGGGGMGGGGAGGMAMGGTGGGTGGMTGTVPAHMHAWAEVTGKPAAASCPAGQRVIGLDVATGMVTCGPDPMPPAQPFKETMGALRYDGKLGIGQDPAVALHVQSPTAQLVLNDLAGEASAGVIINSASTGQTDNLNVSWQRASTTVATIFLSADNSLAYQTTDATHRFKISPAKEAMRIDGATGNIGIGTSMPTQRLVVSDGTPPDAYSDGNTWVNACSRDTKEGIRAFAEKDYAQVDRWLSETQVVWYRYRGDGDPRRRVGLIAEDVPAVLATPDRKGISTADAVGFLTAALKSQSSELGTIRAEKTRLEQQNRTLADKLGELERRLSRLEARR